MLFPVAACINNLLQNFAFFIFIFQRRPLDKTHYMKKLIFSFLFMIPAATVFCQREDSLMIKKISDEILVNGMAYENLRYLTKKIGGTRYS